MCARGCNEDGIEEIDEEEVIQNGVRDTLRDILFECPNLQGARERWTRELENRGGEWTLAKMFT